MATRLTDEFPSRTKAPTAAYPDGSYMNETAPGANDGTPLDERIGDDYEGLKQGLLDKAGITPNGQPDSVTNPQQLQAIEKFIGDGDSQLAGGAIWPLSSQDSLSLGAQSTIVSIDADIFRVNTGSDIELLYLWEPSGTLPAAPFTIENIVYDSAIDEYTFTIDAVDYIFITKRNLDLRDQYRVGGYNMTTTSLDNSSQFINLLSTEGKYDLDQGTYTFTNKVSWDDSTFVGRGFYTNLTYNGNEGTGNTFLEVSRVNARFAKFEGMSVRGTATCDIGQLMQTNFPRIKLENMRFGYDEGGVVETLLHVKSSFIATLDSVYTISPNTGDDIIGLLLGDACNSIDILGGEYANKGDGIVIAPNFEGVRVNIQTTIEGSVAQKGKGLRIEAGSGILVDSYFEDKGMVINGGSDITVNGTFLNSQSTIFVNSGEDIKFDRVNVLAEFPRDAIIINSGLDQQVTFTRNGKFFDPTRTFVLSNSYVSGEDLGVNLLDDPYFDNWTDPNTPTDFTISKIGASAIVSQDSSEKQQGRFSLKWDNNGFTDPGLRGLTFDFSSLIPSITLKKTVIGFWVRVANTGLANYTFDLLSDGFVSAPLQKQAVFDAVDDRYIFVSFNFILTNAATTFDLRIAVPGGSSPDGSENFNLDRIAIIPNTCSENIPFNI